MAVDIFHKRIQDHETKEISCADDCPACEAKSKEA